MFIGPGVRQPGPIQGLGLFNPTATGIAVGARPTCVTLSEKTEAQAKCRVAALRGLGQTVMTAMAPMSGRLAFISPCTILDLPICPTPHCLDSNTAQIILTCGAGGTVPGIDCKNPGVAMALYTYAQLPYCSTPGFLPPLPDCLTPDMITGRNYCLAHPDFQGPTPILNADCWAAMHDHTYWEALMARRLCSPPIVRVPPRTAPPPKPTAVPGPSGPTMAPPTTVAPPAMMPPTDEAPPPEEPVKHEAQAMGLFGILALVAVAGGGYYLYRRSKR